MACTDKAAKDILNSCDTIPVAGFEKKGWILNRGEFEATLDGTVNNLVTAIAMGATFQAYTVTAVKKENDGGFDLSTADNLPDTFLNYYKLQPYEKDGASIVNMDSMSDIVVIMELKGEKEEGTFVIYGLEHGLFKSSATQRVNDNSGLPVYEFQNMEGQGERYSRYLFWDTDYDTTVLALEALETP